MTNGLPPSPRTPVPATILFVGDPSHDAHLAEPLGRQKLRNEVCLVARGMDAIAALRGDGPDCPAGRPDLILLDETLPREDVSDLLREVKSDPALREIPVVVIASSREDADAAREGSPGAAAYAIGPVRFRQLAHIVQSIPGFGLTIGTHQPDVPQPEPALLA